MSTPGAPLPRLSRHLAIVAVGLLFAAGCSGATDLASPTTAPSAPTAMGRIPTAVGPTKIPPTQPPVGISVLPESFVPVPLRLKIFDASAIARASLLSSEAKTEAESSRYYAVHSFRFRATGYLKGTGTAEIIVTDRSIRFYLTEKEALQAASDSLAKRDTSRDTHEAVLFLGERYQTGGSGGVESEQPADAFRFLRSGPYEALQYTIDTLNRVWLPAKNPPAAGEAADAAALLFLTGEPVASRGSSSGAAQVVGAKPSTISLEKLRSEIAAVDALIKAGDGTAEYSACVRSIWAYEHTYNALEWREGRTWAPHRVSSLIASGAAEGTKIDFYEPRESKYSRHWLEGTDGKLFEVVIVDTDNLPSNGYRVQEATARPLPAGTYQFSSHIQGYHFMPCNFVPDKSYIVYDVTVTAPTGTAHEAFFDPVAIGTGFGADGTNGVLKPKAFTVGGSSASLSSLTWQGGSVVLTLSPYAALTGQTLDVLAVDGALTLSLAAASATVDATAGTLTWSVASQPWKAGDQLMLRLRTGWAWPTSTPTPTPSVTATPTFGPTPTPS